MQTSESATGTEDSLQDSLDSLEVYSRCCSSLPQRSLPTCQATSGRQHLRSASSRPLLVQRVLTAAEQRSFAVNGPTTWNSLLPALRASELSQNAFTRALKTHLFSTARYRWDVRFYAIPTPNTNALTDLLTYPVAGQANTLIIMPLIKPKFTRATNATLCVSVRQNFFSLFLK